MRRRISGIKKNTIENEKWEINVSETSGMEKIKIWRADS